MSVDVCLFRFECLVAAGAVCSQGSQLQVGTGMNRSHFSHNQGKCKVLMITKQRQCTCCKFFTTIGIIRLVPAKPYAQYWCKTSVRNCFE